MSTESATKPAFEDALRIRLEGRLEVLEQAAEALEALVPLARAGWERDADEARVQLARWRAVGSKLGEARDVAQRHPEVEAIVRRIDVASAALLERLGKHFEGTDVGRASELSSRLAAWGELVHYTGRPRSGPPLAEAQLVLSSQAPLAVATVAACVLLAVLRQWVFAGLVAAFSLLLSGVSRRRVTWRLFDDRLEVEPNGEPVLATPLTWESGSELPSLRALLTDSSGRRSRTLTGLRDLELPRRAELAPLYARFDALREELLLLRKEELLLERFAGAPSGPWLPSRRLPSKRETITEQKGPVSIVYFPGQGVPAGPRGPSPRLSSTRAAPSLVPGSGRTLLLDRGLCFVPDDAQSAVREAVTGVPTAALAAARQRRFEALPTAAFVERLDAVRAVSGVEWIALPFTGPWESTEDGERLTLETGTLVVTVDAATRERLRAQPTSS